MNPNYTSESRIRMNNSLHERLQSQMALRDALRNLEKAQTLVRECRARYDSAKTIVQTTAEKECDALLLEETPWNNMFHQLKKYKDVTGTVNVKLVEDNKSPEMARLSAWIGKKSRHYKPTSFYHVQYSTEFFRCSFFV
jgi:exonuclease VII small subunit